MRFSIFEADLMTRELRKWAARPVAGPALIGLGLGLAVSAMLLSLPFGQRTLVPMAYR